MPLGMEMRSKRFPSFHYRVMAASAESAEHPDKKNPQSAQSKIVQKWRPRPTSSTTVLIGTLQTCDTLITLSASLLFYLSTQELQPICSPSCSPARTARVATSATAR